MGFKKRGHKVGWVGKGIDLGGVDEQNGYNQSELYKSFKKLIKSEKNNVGYQWGCRPWRCFCPIGGI